MKHFILAFLFSIVVPALAQAEIIHYDIYAGFKVGKATLEIVGPTEFKGQKTILIVFKAESIKINDVENIYLDPKTLKPLFVERTYNNEKISEDYFTDKSKIKITKTVDSKTTEQVLDNKGVENIYGFIYRYRKTGSFKLGEVLQLNLPTKQLKVKLIKQMPLNVKGTKYDTFYMQSVPSKYLIWFDATGEKVPVRITSSLGMAKTTMLMSKYEK